MKNVNDLERNQKVLKEMKKIKVYSDGKNADAEKRNKLPKKENEYVDHRVHDPIYEAYGYCEPSKIRSGNITLAKFDHFLDGYKKVKTMEYINDYAEENRIDATTLHIFLDNYKPFLKIDGNSKKSEDPFQLKLDSVFPNVSKN